MRNCLSILFALWASAAFAAPPDPGSDDWNVMLPYQEWIQGQHDNLGRSCCSIADGRPVDVRIRDGHWEVHITKQHFPDEDDRWVGVPDEKVIRSANPTGVPIVWFSWGRVLCFAPPDGT